MELIRGSEFIQKVTEASEGLWVVVYLFKESNPACLLLGPCLEELAHKYTNTKFVKIISTDCIPKYPDINLPTVLLYNNRTCKQHLVGLGLFGGHHITPEQVTLALNSHGPICTKSSEVGEAQQLQTVKDLVKRMVESKEQLGSEDESSDFEDS